MSKRLDQNSFLLEVLHGLVDPVTFLHFQRFFIGVLLTIPLLFPQDVISANDCVSLIFPLPRKGKKSSAWPSAINDNFDPIWHFLLDFLEILVDLFSSKSSVITFCIASSRVSQVDFDTPSKFAKRPSCEKNG